MNLYEQMQALQNQPVYAGFNTPAKEKATRTGTIGVLSVRHLQAEIARQSFLGRHVRLWLGTGLIRREFVISGDKDGVDEILARLAPNDPDR